MNKKTNKFDYMIGQRFGDLTVLEILGTDPKRNHARLCKCVCDCGGEVTPTCRQLIGGMRSCGCKAGNYKHGFTGHKLHDTWRGMLNRCNNENEPAYENYGGRGIRVCERWTMDFKSFYDDMGSTYRKGLTLDRIDVNGDYCKENCRWADRQVQSNNTRRTVYFEANGVRKSIHDWAKDLGLTHTAMYLRVRRGWTDEEILNTPLKVIKA